MAAGSQFRLHNDEPTLIDQLGRAALVEEVGNAIATCSPPQVLGVHGDWGLGKTSFLQQVQWYLVGECPQQSQDEQDRIAKTKDVEKGAHKKHMVVIWFEAWRYQEEDVPVVALLQEMRTQLDWHVKLRQSAKKLTEVTIRGALFSMEELTKKIGIQASKVQAVGEKWEREHLATALPSHTIREHMKTAIDQLLPHTRGKTPPRLVILIDDLDRCEPAAAYRLLEGLKIYLTLQNCVFVLGMNQNVIEDAIGSRLPPQKRELRSARAAAYMEKLCQNVWRLPSVRDPKDLLVKLLPNTVVGVSIAAAIGNHACLPPNPRRIKGLANLIQRLADRIPDQGLAAGHPETVRQAKLMLIVAYVYQFHNDLYLRWENEPSLYDRILEWSQNIDVNLSVFKRLERVQSVARAEDTPTPRFDVTSAYPDPTASNVFWIQPLIHELGNSVTGNDFLPYLRETTQ